MQVCLLPKYLLFPWYHAFFLVKFLNQGSTLNLSFEQIWILPCFHIWPQLVIPFFDLVLASAGSTILSSWFHGREMQEALPKVTTFYPVGFGQLRVRLFPEPGILHSDLDSAGSLCPRQISVESPFWTPGSSKRYRRVVAWGPNPVNWGHLCACLAVLMSHWLQFLRSKSWVSMR